jgi:CheY-like chemotaxis protein
MAAGPNALRGSGSNRKPALESALTQADSPDPRNDRICITSSCPRQLVLPIYPLACRQQQFRLLVSLSPVQDVVFNVEKDTPKLAGKRLLAVEDEPLVALDIIAALEGAGADVVGSAGTAKEALNIIDNLSPDAALLDANLCAHPVDEIAAALVAGNIPFLFVTGYGQGTLSKAFAKTTMLSKPFSHEQLIATWPY